MRKLALIALSGLFSLVVLGQSRPTEAADKRKADPEKQKPALTLSTNDLQPAKFDAGPPAEAAPAAEGEGAEAAPAEEGKGKDEGKKEKTQDDVNDEYMGKLTAKYREMADLERQRDVAILEYNRLRNDYFKMSDGVYRDNVVRQKRDAAFKRIDDTKQAVEKSKEQLSDLENEARKNGVPPGVIRKARDNSVIPDTSAPAPGEEDQKNQED
ncbi:MAG: hypothetical protein KA419_06135 [Acidobacteria bacterium]|nr:hypothetical protein [Acidobacteriota bacterium]